MNIIEATKQATENGKSIYNTKSKIKVKPTDTVDCYMLERVDDGKINVGRWNPKAKDILSNDWIVV